jgi:cell division topological specificity factor
VNHERAMRNAPSYLPQLQKELLKVIKKYVKVSDDAVSIQVDRDDRQEVLELNITLPER